LSVSPFKKPQTGEERQTLWQRLTQVTRQEVVDADAVLGKARAFLEWRSMPYMESYVEWLRRQANAPMPIGDHLQMVATAARGSAYRDILDMLRAEEAKARSALGE